MDYNIIEKLMKQMSESNLTKLELEEAGFRICLEKNLELGAVQNNMSATQIPNEKVHIMDNSYVETVVPETVQTLEEDSKMAYVKSPIVGTFYTSSSPEKPPFVKVGDTVEKGQVLCIIESMKLMNEIESDVSGEVAEILVSNEDMVEFGQKMFAILP